MNMIGVPVGQVCPRPSPRRSLTAWVAGTAAAAGAAQAWAQRQSITWDAPVSGLFSDHVRWLERAVPTAEDDVIFGNLAGVNPFTVTLDADATTYSLRVANQNAVLDLGGRVWTVRDDLSLIPLPGGPRPRLEVRNGTLEIRGEDFATQSVIADGDVALGPGGRLVTRSVFDLAVTDGGTLRVEGGTLLGGAAVGGRSGRMEILAAGRVEPSSVFGRTSLLVSGQSPGPNLLIDGVVDLGSGGLIVGSGIGTMGHAIIRRGRLFADAIQIGAEGGSGTLEVHSPYVLAGRIDVGSTRYGSSPSTPVSRLVSSVGIQASDLLYLSDSTPSETIVGLSGQTSIVLLARSLHIGAQATLAGHFSHKHPGLMSRPSAVQHGTLSPGASPGQIGSIGFSGPLVQSETATTVIDLAGEHGVFRHDRVSGSVSMNGLWELRIAPGTQIPTGTRLLLANGATGRPLRVRGSWLDHSGRFLFSDPFLQPGQFTAVQAFAAEPTEPEVWLYYTHRTRLGVSARLSGGRVVDAMPYADWSSSSTDVAVDQSGAVRALGRGGARVSAEVAGVQGHADVNVFPVPPATLPINTNNSGGTVLAYSPHLSGDGTLAAFMLPQRVLVGGFLRDRWIGALKNLATGRFEEISTAPGGELIALAIDEGSGSIDLTPDGTHAVLVSGLLENSTVPPYRAWLKNLTTGALVELSVDVSGTPLPSPVIAARVSADTQTVVLLLAESIGAQGVVGPFRPRIIDRRARRAWFPLDDAAGGPQNDPTPGQPAISANGRTMLYHSSLPVTGDPPGLRRVFAYDIPTRRWSLVSATAQGAAPTEGFAGYIVGSPIDASGRKVVFVSTSRLVGPSIPGTITQQAYFRDLDTGEIRIFSRGTTSSANDFVGSPAISADGRWGFFRSAATNLVPGDVNGFSDVFRVDLQTGAVKLVSRDFRDRQGNGDSSWTSPSADGSVIAFQTAADNLLPFGPGGSGLVARRIVDCPGDWDLDGSLSFDDLLAFMNELNLQGERADLNFDEAFDFLDLLVFLNRYNTPC